MPLESNYEAKSAGQSPCRVKCWRIRVNTSGERGSGGMQMAIISVVIWPAPTECSTDDGGRWIIFGRFDHVIRCGGIWMY